MPRGQKRPPQESIDSILLAISRREDIEAETLSHYFDRLDEEWLDGARTKVINLLRSNDVSAREAAIFILSELATDDDLEILEDFVSDPTISDMAKLSLASILKELGSEMADDGIIEYLNDPAAAMQQMQLRLLKLVEQSEMGIESILKDVLSMPADRRLAFVSWLGQSNDPRAAHLLIPLLENQSSKMVMAVIEALEQLGAAAAQQSLPALNYLVSNSSNRAIKQRAREALGRLTMQAAPGTEDAAMEARHTQLPTYEARVSFVDGSGAQLIMISWQRPDGQLKGFNVLFQDRWGIKDCYGIDEMDVERWEDLIADLEDQGFSSFQVPYAYAHTLISEARQLSKKLRHKLPIAFSIWRPLLEAEEVKQKESQIALMELPAINEETLALAQRGAELYNQPEFMSWMYEDTMRLEPFMTRYWGIDSILDADVTGKRPQKRSTRKSAKSAKKEQERKALLDSLINEAIQTLVDDEWRTLYSTRLRRQGMLFLFAKGEPTVALIAATAAVLAPGSPVPLQEQPFVQTMMQLSIEQGPLRMLMESLDTANNGELSPFDE